MKIGQETFKNINEIDSKLITASIQGKWYSLNRVYIIEVKTRDAVEYKSLTVNIFERIGAFFYNLFKGNYFAYKLHIGNVKILDPLTLSKTSQKTATAFENSPLNPETSGTPVHSKPNSPQSTVQSSALNSEPTVIKPLTESKQQSVVQQPPLPSEPVQQESVVEQKKEENEDKPPLSQAQKPEAPLITEEKQTLSAEELEAKEEAEQAALGQKFEQLKAQHLLQSETQKNNDRARVEVFYTGNICPRVMTFAKLVEAAIFLDEHINSEITKIKDQQIIVLRPDDFSTHPTLDNFNTIQAAFRYIVTQRSDYFKTHPYIIDWCFGEGNAIKILLDETLLTDQPSLISKVKRTVHGEKAFNLKFQENLHLFQ